MVPVVPPVIIMIVIEYLVGPPGGIHQIPHVIPCLGGLGRYCSPKERRGSQYNHRSPSHVDISRRQVMDGEYITIF
jgi:hypothetical protein